MIGPADRRVPESDGPFATHDGGGGDGVVGDGAAHEAYGGDADAQWGGPSETNTWGTWASRAEH